MTSDAAWPGGAGSLPFAARRWLRCGERIGNEDNHLAFAMRAKALLAGVLVFDFKDVSVGTFDANSHVRPASRTTEDLEKKRSPGVAA